MPSNHFILCPPLLLPPSVFPSIRVFSNESVLHIRWPKYWSLSFSMSPPSEYSGLISFKMDWLDLLAVQGTLKSLLQRHSSKASILRLSAFFIFKFLSLLSKTVLLYLLPHAWSFGNQELLEVFVLSPSLPLPSLTLQVAWVPFSVPLARSRLQILSSLPSAWKIWPYILWSPQHPSPLCVFHAEQKQHFLFPRCTLYFEFLIIGWF